jgi:hypothetical protein
MRRFLALLATLAVGCADAAPATTQDGDYTSGDFAEDSVLPYAGDWLDPPKALGGVGQFDRLRSTIHDDAKCSTMVGLAAAIVGGEERFTRFVDETARRRAGHADDLAIIERVRAAVAQKKLTPRHLHELTEAVARAFGVIYGAFDPQIATMVKASGYTPVHVGSTKPQVLVDHLDENEVVPLGVVTENIPHITLLWKDARGTVRLYDSDDIGGGVHVLPRGSALYNVRINAADSSWDLAEKYR